MGISQDNSRLEERAVQGQRLVLPAFAADMGAVKAILYASAYKKPADNCFEAERTSLVNVFCISPRVFPRCFAVSPMPATLIRTASIPASIISASNSSWGLCQR